MADVIPPITGTSTAITPAMLTSSTAAEPSGSESVYSAATAYAVGAAVIGATDHRSYESLQGGTPQVVTITNASPGVVTWTSHGFAAGTPVLFTTTGALPTGLVAGTVYYVSGPTTNAFSVAATVGGAAINTSSAGSGVHTALANPNKNHTPGAVGSEEFWLDVGASNRWKMFDLLRNDATEAASPLVVEITPGAYCNAIGMVDLVADSVLVEVLSGATVIYSELIDLSARIVVDWYDYYYAPFSYKTRLALFDLPPRIAGKVRLTLTRASGNVRCGRTILGASVYLGSTQHGAESDELNFSVITRNEQGETYLDPRRSIPKTTQTIWCEKAQVDKVRAARKALNAVPAFYSWLSDRTDGYFEAGVTVGVYKRFSIAAEHPTMAIISLETEEV